jgi:hypothetical protein
MKGRSLGQKIIYKAQNFVTQEPKLTVIISGEFVVSVWNTKLWFSYHKIISELFYLELKQKHEIKVM